MSMKGYDWCYFCFHHDETVTNRKQSCDTNITGQDVFISLTHSFTNSSDCLISTPDANSNTISMSAADYKAWEKQSRTVLTTK